MAYAEITFEQKQTGSIKTAPVGFSWTVFFFGFFPALFRSDFKWFLIIILLGFCTFGISNLFFSFTYNKAYIKELIAAGYKATPTTSVSLDQISTKLGFDIPKA